MIGINLNRRHLSRTIVIEASIDKWGVCAIMVDRLMLHHRLCTLSYTEVHISWQLSLAYRHRRLSDLLAPEASLHRIEELLCTSCNTEEVLRCLWFSIVVLRIEHQVAKVAPLGFFSCFSWHQYRIIGGQARLAWCWEHGYGRGSMLTREVECPRVLLVKPVIIAGPWAQLNFLKCHFFIWAEMNIIIPTLLPNFVFMLVLIWCRRGLGTLHLYKRKENLVVENKQSSERF